MLVLLVLLLSNPIVAYSASGIAKVDIKEYDVSNFPEITFFAQVSGTDGSPVHGLEPNEVTIQDGANSVREFSLEPSDLGTHVSIVIDAGAGINASGATFQSRLAEIQQVVRSYVQRMEETDYAEVVVLRAPNQVSVIQDFTNEKNLITSALNNLVVESGAELSYGLEGISRGLDNLAGTGNRSGYKAVLFLSTGLQVAGRRFLTMQELQTKANNLEIPVHTMLFGGTDRLAHNLDNIAIGSGGQYVYYSRAQVETPIFDYIFSQGMEYKISYRTSDAAPSRIVTFTVLPGIDGNVFDDFRLELDPVPGPAEVTSIAINNNDPLIREPDERAGEYTYWPIEVPVQFSVNWPDGYGTRAIQWAEFVVDGNVVGGRITDTPPGNQISTTWDLRAFTDSGETSHNVQVRFVDELGFEVISPIHTVPLTIRTGLCGQYEGTAQLTCMLGSVVAPGLGVISFLLVAGVLGYYFLRPDDFRARFGGVQAKVQKFADEVTQTLRIRGRGGDGGGQIPMAYLHVIKGTLGMRTRYPLYQRVTQIGRDDPALKIEDGDIAIADKAVSRPHLSIAVHGDEYTVTDMGSANGSWLNGMELEAEEEQLVREGDVIELAEYEPGERLIAFTFSLYGETPDGSGVDNFVDDDITTPTRKKKSSPDR